MSDIIIGFIPVDKLPLIWPKVECMIMEAIDIPNPDFTIEDVAKGLTNGGSWLVVVTSDGKILSALVCSEFFYPSKKVLHVDICCGPDIHKWKMQIVDFLKQGAMNIGATEIEWVVKKGLDKFYKDVAEFKHVTMTIKVE